MMRSSVWVDDVLDARAHVLDPARGEGLDDEAAQAGVIGRVLLQHPMAHAADYGLLHDLGGRSGGCCARPKSLPKRLFAQHEARLGVTAGNEGAMRVDVHRVHGAQPRVIRIGVADEFGRQWIEKAVRCSPTERARSW